MDDNIAKLTSIIDIEWRTKHFKTQKFHNRDDSDNLCLLVGSGNGEEQGESLHEQQLSVKIVFMCTEIG